MDDEPASGVERSVFGPVNRAEIDTWLGKHVRARLGVAVSGVAFHSGRVAAV
jgi:hypothetical protein